MSTQKRKIILKKLTSHDTIWHPESTLVFKSQKERLVIGTYKDGNIVPLDDEALELCDEWGFKPDESLIQADSNDDQEEGEDDEEDDEQDEEDTPEQSKVEPKIEPKIEPKVVQKVEQAEVSPFNKNTDYKAFGQEYIVHLSKAASATNDTILKLCTHLQVLKEENNDVNSKLAKLQEEYNKTEQAHKDLKAKFDAMKSLFS